jgi:hypothetical protein
MASPPTSAPARFPRADPTHHAESPPHHPVVASGSRRADALLRALPNIADGAWLDRDAVDRFTSEDLVLRSRLLLLLLGCLAMSSVATGANASTPTVIAGVPVEESLAPAQAAAACLLQNGTPITTAIIWTPPEELTSFAWKVPISTCTACGSTPLTLQTLTFRIRWFNAGAAQTQISIVGAKQGTTCLEPDTTKVLCPGATYSLVATTSGTLAYTLPFTGGCCVTGPAFVFLRFSGLGSGANATTSPGLISSTLACAQCEQFATASIIYPNMVEWCSIGASRQSWFSIAADCCTITLTRHGTWGSVKTRYQ